MCLANHVSMNQRIGVQNYFANNVRLTGLAFRNLLIYYLTDKAREL